MIIDDPHNIYRNELYLKVINTGSYVGTDVEGCFFLAMEKVDGWYVTIVVDSPKVTDDFLEIDKGPFRTWELANVAGEETARCWCIDRGIL